jgi:hypothetical protein
MTPKYKYPEFKRLLCTKPKWIIRGLTVLAHSPDIATPKNIHDIEECLRAIRQNGGELPVGYGRMSDIVFRQAPTIYNYYVQLRRRELLETTS